MTEKEHSTLGALEEVEASSEIPETLEVQNLEHFIAIISDWHGTRVQELEQIMQVPEGVSVTFNEDAPVDLVGDLRQGFIMGISLALMRIGTLPFVVQDVDEPIH